MAGSVMIRKDDSSWMIQMYDGGGALVDTYEVDEDKLFVVEGGEIWDLDSIFGALKTKSGGLQA